MQKKLKNISCLFLLFLMVFIRTTVAQEIPKLQNVIIHAEVSYDLGAQLYRYLYEVKNGIESTGEVFSIDIDISRPVGSVTLKSDGLTFPAGKKMRVFEEELGFVGETISVVPIGMRKPTGWDTGISVNQMAGWGSINSKFRLKPGQTLSGFEIISYGLPGIRKAEIRPKFVLSVNDFVSAEDIKRANEIEKQIIYPTKTIGPTAPLANFVPLDFLSYLVDLKHQAQALGWIGGPKLVEELDKKLDQVREKLLEGNIESAQGKLKSFIEKVEAHFKETKEHEIEKIKEKKGKEIEDKKFVTSEGYGLLVFNAQYLRDQLGTSKEHEDEEGEKESKK